MKKFLCLCLALLMLGAAPALAEDWVCPSCEHAGSGNFCSECGAAKPAEETDDWTCPDCGADASGKFCQNCGTARSGEVVGTISEEVLGRVAEATAQVPTAVTPSPDKYTWYVADYVGRNLASVGYTSMGGDRMDAYGAGYIKLIPITVDGTYVDISDEDVLKQYVVLGQSPAANTEIEYIFEKDSKGQEYFGLINNQSLEQLDLIVARIDGRVYNDLITYEPVTFPDPPDRYTRYIRSYVGKNLAAVGYTSMGGDRMDSYGAAYVELVLMTTDGSFIDVEDETQLASYVVTSQDVTPGAAMQLVYEKDSKGKEYSNLIDTQTYERITLTVSRITPAPVKSTPAAKEETSSQNAAGFTADTTPSAAAGTIAASDDFTYTVLEDGTAQITGYSGSSSYVSISSDLDGYTVTKISPNVFEGHTELTSVLMWADPVEIGEACFKGCTGLTDISISSDTKRIGTSAFEGCTALKTVILWGDPNIGDRAFMGCTALDSISIGSDTEYIGVSAFEGCTSLKSAILWGATTIGDSAFRGCTALDSISIDSDTPSIGDYAFEGCSSLESAILWGSDTNVGKGAFDNCPKLDHVSQW